MIAMEKPGCISLTLLVASQWLLVIASQDTIMTGWVSIDCGNNNSRSEGILLWDVDSRYTQTGSNKQVQKNTIREEFNTLRFFPNKTHDNCYIIPADTQTRRHIIRSGFYYGNYDGLCTPPTFDLFIDDFRWETLNTSKNNGEPFYKKIVYGNGGSGFFKICLVQITDGDVPFINSLETVYLPNNVYKDMVTNATYSLVTRTNFGGEEIRFGPDNYDEIYNHIWTKGVTPSNCVGIPYSSGFTFTYENQPPYSVLLDSVESTGNNPLILTVDIPESIQQAAYFAFYITYPDFPRTMLIEIDGQYVGIIQSRYTVGVKVVIEFGMPVRGPNTTITLTRSNDSTFPPIIAAMEVFTQWEPTHRAGATIKYFSFVYSLIFLLIFLLLI